VGVVGVRPRVEGEPDPEAAVAYLAEHGLLTEWEREALARIQPVGASFKPERMWEAV
jgi:hypothetical protein